MTISRRRLIQGTVGLSALGGLAALRPNDLGSNHSTYFKKMSHALKKAEYSGPTLIIDSLRLDKNTQTLKNHIGEDYNYRIVVKSLPCIGLLKRISEATNTQRFMVFDEKFLLEITHHFPNADILLGKPLPALGTNKTLKQISHSNGSKIRWLVDNNERLHNYESIAVQRQQTLQINLEIDIGLHRGGFTPDKRLSRALSTIKDSPFLEFDGFMGYEPHVVKVPGDQQSHLLNALKVYKDAIKLAKSTLKDEYPTKPILNTAGSPSYQLHTSLPSEQRVGNELSAGSCLVKPSDFDLPSLDDHMPAAFIACPILKALDNTQIPGVPGLGRVMAWWNPNLKRSFFTYGGNWKAKPVSPVGLSYNPLYGRSSNQEMINASIKNPLAMNDWIFLRPTQSESVFLQFGDIALFDGESFIDNWPVFS